MKIGFRFRRSLKENMWGEDVCELQELLKLHGFMADPPDGYYGPITADAVMEFQHSYGLTVDGIAGTKTLGLLSDTKLPILRKRHVVEDGQDIFQIAKLYNTTAKAIMTANKLKKPGAIYYGQELTIHEREIYLKNVSQEALAIQNVGFILPGLKLTTNGTVIGDLDLEFPTQRGIYMILEIDGKEIPISKSKWCKNAAERISRLLSIQELSGLVLTMDTQSPRSYLKLLRELSKVMTKKNQELILILPAIQDISPARVGEWRAVLALAAKVIFSVSREANQSLPGPITPYEHVLFVIRTALILAPSYKLIMELPIHALDWQKKKDEVTLKQIPIREIGYLQLQGKCCKCWDPSSRSPYVKYRAQRVFHEVWYEDNTSLGYKLELINKFNLRGILVNGCEAGISAFFEEALDRFTPKSF